MEVGARTCSCKVKSHITLHHGRAVVDEAIELIVPRRGWLEKEGVDAGECKSRPLDLKWIDTDKGEGDPSKTKLRSRLVCRDIKALKSPADMSFGSYQDRPLFGNPSCLRTSGGQPYMVVLHDRSLHDTRTVLSYQDSGAGAAHSSSLQRLGFRAS
eukprot:4951760-Amphidinium_carterae.1